MATRMRACAVIALTVLHLRTAVGKHVSGDVQKLPKQQWDVSGAFARVCPHDGKRLPEIAEENLLQALNECMNE